MIKLNRKLNKEQQLKNKRRKFMIIENKKLKEVPIFFASDNNYAACLGVTIQSLKDTASSKNKYLIHILNTGLSEENERILKSMETENVKISLFDITSKVKYIYDKLEGQLRDYFSPSIYYRLFIPTLFPQYKKGLYLDCDITILEDVANLYNHDLKNNLIGAIVDEVVSGSEDLQYYTEKALGINGHKYFNSGIILLNLEGFRKENIEDKFIYLLNNYNFGTVAPDQDYLNVLCKNRVLYIDKGWDKMTIPDENFDEKDLKIVHYNFFKKPWKYEGVMYEKYFWEAAKKTPYYQTLLDSRKNYPEEQKLKDEQSGGSLIEYAMKMANDPTNFKNTFDRECKCLLIQQNKDVEFNEETNVLEDFFNIIFKEDEEDGLKEVKC